MNQQITIGVNELTSILDAYFEKSEARLKSLEIKVNDLKDRNDRIPILTGYVHELLQKLGNSDVNEIVPKKTTSKKKVDNTNTVESLEFYGNNNKSMYNIYVTLVKEDAKFKDIILQEWLSVDKTIPADVYKLNYVKFYEEFLSKNAKWEPSSGTDLIFDMIEERSTRM